MSSMPFKFKERQKQLLLNDFSGGVNLSREGSLISKNELSDANNVYIDGNVLKSRMGLKSNTDKAGLLGFQEVYINRDITRTVETENGVETYCLYVSLTQNDGITLNVDFVCLTDAQKKIHINSKRLDGVYYVANCLTFQEGNTLYLLLHTNFTFESLKYKFFKTSLADDTVFFNEVNDDNVYIPTIYSGCKAGTKHLDEIEKYGQFVEDYNLISDYYKLIYSAVDPTLETTCLRYALLDPLAKAGALLSYAIGKTVTVKIFHPWGSVATHTATVQNLGNGIFGKESTSNSVDGFTLYLHTNYIELCGSDGKAAVLNSDNYAKNNVEITAPWDARQKNVVLGATRCKKVSSGGKERVVMFSNAAYGYESAISYSEGTLYFPKTNYKMLGRAHESVTAVQGVGDDLTVFKEREIFEFNCNANGKFTVRQVSDIIGCDCPDTIELCANRLVWLCSDGRVYTLLHRTSFDERVVVPISDSITPVLKSFACKELKSAHSVDWQDKYVLQIGNKMLLLYYNSYGYKKAGDVNKLRSELEAIPWFIWEIPIIPKQLILADNRLLLPYVVVDTKQNLFVNLATFDEQSQADFICNFLENDDFTVNKMPYVSSFATATISCDKPFSLKRIVSVNLNLTHSGRVTATLVADGVKTDTVLLPQTGKEKLFLSANKKVCKSFKYAIQSNDSFSCSHILTSFYSLGGINL